MNQADSQTIRDLINQVESKDKKFRLFQGVFMGVVAIMLIALIGAQFFVINQFQSQSAERAAGIKKIAETAQHNTELSNQYLQCIARFFATTDRQSRVLTDLDDCVYEQNGTVIPGLDNSPTGQTTTPAPLVVTPDMPGLTPLNPQQDQSPAEPEGNTVPDPVEILGIPLCVPFTGLCVR